MMLAKLPRRLRHRRSLRAAGCLRRDGRRGGGQAESRAPQRHDPVCCVGETIDERDIGLAQERLSAQVGAALGAVPAEAVAGMVIAYEPISAIGTGQAATPEDAQDACAWIRGVVATQVGEERGHAVRIQYGGSVKAANTEELMACPDVDGLLVGGASLDGDSSRSCGPPSGPAVEFGSVSVVPTPRRGFPC